MNRLDIVRERLVADEDLLEAGNRLIPAKVLRRRLRARGYDWDAFVADVKAAKLEIVDSPLVTWRTAAQKFGDNKSVRVTWPDGEVTILSNEKRP